ncbi:replication protein A 70 kDa DNA-binding subunit B-like [Coffea arabica]|uniref:Replication protein A 70 kDa DNA-binding subunit B-like n=1 Tax=Coffea arabica TaxID=13443 RepID=A0ABM4V9R0_COFAR
MAAESSFVRSAASDWNRPFFCFCAVLLFCCSSIKAAFFSSMTIEPLRVSEVYSSLARWTSVIQVIEASHLKTTYANHASRMYRRFVFADSHIRVKVSAVAFDDNVARIDGLLVPFKKYFISDAAVDEIPRPAPSDLYRFFWVINSATMIKEVFEPETPILPLFFDLTPFTSFQHFADSQISINMMGVVLHTLPVKESRPEVPSVVSRDYVVADQSNMPIILTLIHEIESGEGGSIVNAMRSTESKPVIIGIRVRVKTDNYLSLYTKVTSVVLVSPQIQEAARLERWLSILAFLYRHNCSVLMTSVLEKRYCNPFVLLPPVGDTMLCTISSVATATRFVRDPALPIFFYFFKAFFLLWNLACPYCFAPNNFIETLGISCVSCLKDLHTFPRALVKLDIADGTASISVIALGYEVEKLIGFTAYQLSQSEYEGVSLNLRVADTLDGKELLCYVKRSPEFIRVTGIRFTVVTSYLVGEASSVEK